MTDPTIPLERLRAQARLLMWLVTVPLVCLGLLALLQFAFAWRMGFERAALMFATYLPMYVYVIAIWMVRRALKAIARGDAFDSVVPKLLQRVGLALFFGALFQVFGGLALGMTLRMPVLSNPFDGAAVTLGVVGATLVLVAQLLRRAAEMREELDAFF